MSIPDCMVDKFINYLEFYPSEDEEGYDGVHDIGWKGLRADAPEEAKKQYAEYCKIEEEAKRLGVKY